VFHRFCYCLIFLFLWSLPAQAQRITFQVFGVDESLRMEVNWLGEKRSVPLTFNDEEATGELSGNDLRFIPVNIYIERNGEEDLIYQEMVPLSKGDQKLFFQVSKFKESVRHQAGAGTEAQRKYIESSQVGLFILWFVSIFIFAGWLKKKSFNGDWKPNWKNWYSPLFWFCFAILWTWPAVQAGSEFLVGRNFDAFGTVWFLWSAPNWDGFYDPLTSWPILLEYSKLDSFILYPIAVLFQWLHPAQVHAWILIFGMATSAWAMEYFAWKLDVRPPWSLIAGLCFIMGGIAATVALEGHVYHLFNPWLPLFAAHWWGACQRGGTRKQAVLAGIFFILSMLTSAYIGLCAVIIAISFWIGHRGWKVRNAYTAAIVVSPFVLLYIWVFFQQRSGGIELDPKAIAVASGTLESFLGATSDVDRASHSLSVGLLAVPVALVLLARHYLRREEGWTVLLGTAIFALILTCGPYLYSNPPQRLFPLPLLWLRDIPGLSLLDFPIRLSWVIFTCIGVLAAKVAMRISEGNRILTWALILLAILDGVVLTRLPFRQLTHSMEVPTALMQSEGPLLTLLPLDAKDNEPNLRWTSLNCLFQIQHQQPIAENCVDVNVNQQSVYELSTFILNSALQGKIEVMQNSLRSAGFRNVVLYPDLFGNGDRLRLQRVLLSLDSTPLESKDGGLWTQVYRISNKQQENVSIQLSTLPETNEWGSDDTLGQADKTAFTVIGNYRHNNSLQLHIQTATKTYSSSRLQPLRSSYRKAYRVLWQEPLQDPYQVSITDRDQQIVWQGTVYPAQTDLDNILIDVNEGFKLWHRSTISLPLNFVGGFVSLIGWAFISIFGFRLWRRYH
jgi:hypothetical protein